MLLLLFCSRHNHLMQCYIGVIFNLIFSDVLSQLAVKVALRAISNQNIFITSVHKSGFFYIYSHTVLSLKVFFRLPRLDLGILI